MSEFASILAPAADAAAEPAQDAWNRMYVCPPGAGLSFTSAAILEDFRRASPEAVDAMLASANFRVFLKP
jgi:hypothetical protein